MGLVNECPWALFKHSKLSKGIVNLCPYETCYETQNKKYSLKFLASNSLKS